MCPVHVLRFCSTAGTCVRHLKISTRISVFPAPHSAVHTHLAGSNSSVAPAGSRVCRALTVQALRTPSTMPCARAEGTPRNHAASLPPPQKRPRRPNPPCACLRVELSTCMRFLIHGCHGRRCQAQMWSQRRREAKTLPCAPCQPVSDGRCHPSDGQSAPL